MRKFCCDGFVPTFAFGAKGKRTHKRRLRAGLRTRAEVAARVDRGRNRSAGESGG
jgi:hypothetical protein